jgi:hypothetical protein
VIFSGEMGRSRGIRFDDTDETDWSACVFEGSPDAQMIPAKDASANHHDSR